MTRWIYTFLILILFFMYLEVSASLPPVNSGVQIQSIKKMGLLAAFDTPEVRQSFTQAMVSGRHRLKISKNRLPSAARR